MNIKEAEEKGYVKISNLFFDDESCKKYVEYIKTQGFEAEAVLDSPSGYLDWFLYGEKEAIPHFELKCAADQLNDLFEGERKLKEDFEIKLEKIIIQKSEIKKKIVEYSDIINKGKNRGRT